MCYEHYMCLHALSHCVHYKGEGTAGVQGYELAQDYTTVKPRESDRRVLILTHSPTLIVLGLGFLI